MIREVRRYELEPKVKAAIIKALQQDEIEVVEITKDRDLDGYSMLNSFPIRTETTAIVLVKAKDIDCSVKLELNQVGWK